MLIVKDRNTGSCDYIMYTIIVHCRHFTTNRLVATGGAQRGHQLVHAGGLLERARARVRQDWEEDQPTGWGGEV